jgi:hypothetical protein
MPAYGNNNGLVRGVNTAIAVTWKAFICIVLGPGLLYLDIAAGANYFQGAFDPYLTGAFNATIPIMGWHINWGHAFVLGFVLSAVCSGIQIALWNFSKSSIKLGMLKPQHYVALTMAGAIFLLDVASDLGGATMWVSSTTNGALWPSNANMFQMITIPVIVICGIANEAILEFFFGIDQPTKIGRKYSRRPVSNSEREKVSVN